ncbi:hypothetical protein L1887_25860 [Cichorium endivia]|nr:hypothetical protein L1887_25860 [Cichorium endivia]
MADFGSNMVDKSTFVMSILVSTSKARAALVEEGGIPVLVEIIEVGSQRQKEITMVILLQICDVPPVSMGLTTVVIPDDWPGFFLWAGVVLDQFLGTRLVFIDLKEDPQKCLLADLCVLINIFVYGLCSGGGEGCQLSSSGPLSHQLQEVVNKGKSVSDEIVFNLLSKTPEAGESKGESGFILDGFPWTITQAEILDQATKIDLVVSYVTWQLMWYLI